jgi:hypothetical protein
MSMMRLSLRKIKEVLHLAFEAGLSRCQTVHSLSISYFQSARSQLFFHSRQINFFPKIPDKLIVFKRPNFCSIIFRQIAMKLQVSTVS